MWAEASLDDVRANVASSRYPAGQIRCIDGKMEDRFRTGADQIAYSARHRLARVHGARADASLCASRAHRLFILMTTAVGAAEQAVDEYFTSATPPASCVA